MLNNFLYFKSLTIYINRHHAVNNKIRLNLIKCEEQAAMPEDKVEDDDMTPSILFDDLHILRIYE